MARREITTFSLSFLDVMACGFGAIILFYMIMSAQVSQRADQQNVELLGETSQLEEQVLDGRKNLVRLKTSVDERLQRMSDLQVDERRLQAEIDALQAQLSALDKTSMASRESTAQLQSDIKQLDAAKQRLLAERAAGDKRGTQVRSFVGDGNRQYLTGMKMGGKRILILVDASASMLGRTYVNAILYRNMPDDIKLRTPKWRSAIDAVDWLTARMPRDSTFQILAFNTTAWSVVDGSQGGWEPVGDATRLTAAVNRLRTTVPKSGTSLYNVFDAVVAMNPQPDNIYLLTDGLPTQGKSPPGSEKLVRPQDRAKFFEQARSHLPGKIPVNVLLYPMDGDPDAAGYFWRLAIDTRGSFMTPAEDWP
jgi:multidrug efflux pump subunit AcrA (membrane-fusion protein)